MSEIPSANEALCLRALQETDHDRYLASLLTPEDRRAAITALYAYNAELARVRDVVREPLPGEVRLQYWRDLLEGSAHGDTAANPVAAELLRAIETWRMPVAPLVAMADARIFDLYDDPMETTDMFEGYAGETAAAKADAGKMLIQAATSMSLKTLRATSRLPVNVSVSIKAALVTANGVHMWSCKVSARVILLTLPARAISEARACVPRKHIKALSNMLGMVNSIGTQESKRAPRASGDACREGMWVLGGREQPVIVMA